MSKTPSALVGTLRAPIVSKDGLPDPIFVRAMTDLDNRITTGLNQQGQFVGTLSNTVQVETLPANLVTLLQHITAAGKLDSLTSVATNVDTDHITDATGHPLAGGKEAYLALVTSGPTAGQVLEWNGTAWVPVTLATGVTSLNALTGALNITAGSGVTVTPSGSNIQIAAAGGGSGYVKGTITIGPQAGAGTYTTTATLTGAVSGNPVLVSTATSTAAANLSSLIGWCPSNNTVGVQYITTGAILSLVLPVVVFN